MKIIRYAKELTEKNDGFGKYYEIATNCIPLRIWFLTDDIVRIRAGFDCAKGGKNGLVDDVTGGNFREASYSLRLTAWEDKLDSFFGNKRTRVQVASSKITSDDSDKTVIQDYWDEFPNLTETEVRNALGAFLFTGEDVFKNISMLSGGEKVRLALCKILKRKPNVLILDEPTNHMDIIGKETLETMLKDFKGTLIFVSHDRYFVKQVATQLLVFEDGTTNLYKFGYEEYQEKLDRDAEIGRAHV